MCVLVSTHQKLCVPQLLLSHIPLDQTTPGSKGYRNMVYLCAAVEEIKKHTGQRQ